MGAVSIFVGNELNLKIITILASALLLAAGSLADDRPQLTVTYYHYPPDIIVKDGKPEGKYIDALDAIATEAGYKVHWLASSIDDEADILNDGRRAICTTGRMPTRERAKRWAFLPFVFDIVAGDIVLALPHLADRIRLHGNITALVKNSSLTGTLLESGVYGDEVDAILAKSPSWILRTGKTDFQLMNMLLAGRAHYTIVPENQWIEARKVHPQTTKLVALPDFDTLPPYPIYVACSRGVGEETMRKLSDAMHALGYNPGTIPE